MNCKQFNQIKLEEVLLVLGHHPTKQTEKEAWYLNPFSNETQASFKLDKRQNIWFLHSEGIGGNNTDFMKKYLNASAKEVLEWAEKHNFSSFHPQTQNPKRSKSNYEITKIKELQNENLKKYLKERGVSQMGYSLLKELHFKINGKNLYAIGFENLSGGWELRNSFYKGSLLKKDISIINFRNENQLKITTKNVAVFEGFMDALSFVEMQKAFQGDLLIMNSIALLKKTKEHLKNYSEIHLFLDNDKAGEIGKNSILKSFTQAEDHSKIYSDFKDLNEYLVSKIKSEFEINQQTQEPEKLETETIYRRKR